MCLWFSSIEQRFCSSVKSRFFFEPVEFYLQLAYLLIQPISQPLLLTAILGVTVAEYFRQALQKLLLPFRDLVRVHLVLCGQIHYRSVALGRGQSNLRLESRTELPSFALHDSFS